ncbi:unnamed protein product [Meloidogyne enterolobii]|uniref:Uncharacterized protein n=1 Tax=Meloidogyne enterolobii TaxID=390850 RepID=A0ACB0YLQ9_MELEN
MKHQNFEKNGETIPSNMNSMDQRQINSEIQRFESVHPCIYRIYDLIGKIENKHVGDLVRQQVMNIENAFVNSQEWTLGRSINEIKLGVLGSDNSFKNSLIHHFLTQNWNWNDAPEGGRFKKEVDVDGQSYLLLIRDEGTREPNFLQFSKWMDALLIVFSLDNRKTFQDALKSLDLVNNHRSLDEENIPIFLVGMKNMSRPNYQRAVTEDEAYHTARIRKMCCYFECLDENDVHPVFNNICNYVARQMNTTKCCSSSYRGNHNCGNVAIPVIPVDSAMPSTSFPLPIPPTNYRHQRSISVMPINNNAHPSFTSSYSSHNNNMFQLDRPPRYEEISTKQHGFPSPNILHNNQSYSFAETPINFDSFSLTEHERCDRKFLLSEQQRYPHFGVEQQQSNIFPAFSHCSLVDSSHCQIPANQLSSAPYTRSSSNMLHQNCFHHHRPCSDPNGSQSPNNKFEAEQIIDSRRRQQQQQQSIFPQTLSAASSCTLAVNNNGLVGNPTPGSTPKIERKSKRISNIFRKEHVPSSEERKKEIVAEKNLGVGRAIPLKQGQLYKRSKNGLNKEWKKKFVCLYSDGRLCYHQNMKEYKEKESRGKEIYLGLATVRTSDRHKQKGNRNSLLPQEINRQQNNRQPCNNPNVFPYEFEDNLKSPTGENSEGITDGAENENCGVGGMVTSTSSSVLISGGGGGFDRDGGKNIEKKESHKEKKKKAKRIGSGLKNDEDEECCEFEIVSCDQKSWEFSASSVEERDAWVSVIEREIERCLQQKLSLKDQQQLSDQRNGQNGDNKARDNSVKEATENRRAEIQALRQIDGNEKCADCNSLNPDWASINLGILICIECSGIHRKLGSHISRVRSLELDDWPFEHIVVMQSIGNTLAKRIWEYNASPASTVDMNSREQKERWIQMKYVEKLFLPPLSNDKTPIQQLVDAVLSRNVFNLLTILPRLNKDDINAPISGSNDKRTVVHLACGIGAPEILQLLIWSNACITTLDDQGRSALWHAQLNGSVDCISILTRAGLRENDCESVTKENKSR